MAKEIPGPKGWPLFGNFKELDMENMHTSFFSLLTKYGGLCKITLVGKTIIVISDRDILEKAFNEEDICHRPKTYKSWLMFDGSGYLDSNFTEKDLKLRSEVWKAIANAEKDATMAKHAGEDLDSFLLSLGTTQGDVPIADLLVRAGARQYAITLTGCPGNEDQVEGILTFLYSMKNVLADTKPLILSVFPWLRFVPGSYKKDVDAVLTSREKVTKILVNDAKKSYIRGEEHGILQHLLSSQDDGKNWFSNVNFKACIVDLLFNGVLPIGQNVAYLLLQAIKHPEMQDKIHFELAGVQPEAVLESKIGVDDFPFTGAFILESMRCFTMVFITAPHLVNKETVVNGYRFPKGSTVFGSTFSINHDEKLFDNPWEFNPYRFLDKSGKLLPESSLVRKSLVFFGVGIRKCKGVDLAMEEVVRLTLGVLLRYKVLAPLNADLPTTDPREYSSRGAIDLPTFSCRLVTK